MVVLNPVIAVRPAAGSEAPRVFPWIARIGRGLGVVLLALAVLAVMVLIVAPRATGSQSYSVLTSSMAPKYAPGTFLVVRPEPFADLRVGDVVTYQIKPGEPAVVTHRIVGIGFLQNGEKTLTTKGDNNSIADPEPVRAVQVRGKLLYAVPYVGYVANAVGQGDRAQWLFLGAVSMIAYGGFTIIRGARASRRDTMAVKQQVPA